MTPPTITDWITAGAAVFALFLSVYSICRQRKSEQQRTRERQEDRETQVKVTTHLTSDRRITGSDDTIYAATITNIGLIGVTIERVSLESAGGGGVSVLMNLPKGEQQRKLDPGESQLWGVRMKTFQIISPEVSVTVVAKDTAGKEHRSAPEDTLKLRGS